MAITFTENAARQIRRQLTKRGKGIAMRIGIKTVGCTGLACTFDIAEEVGPTDHSFEAHNARVLIDAESLVFLDGSRIDFVTEGPRQMFKFDNPNVDSECGCGESFNMKSKPNIDTEATP
ncbi:MAG: iron-sulfur cluster assembly protein [Candidatus Azotimanducaceae bacterium]|jgi:iron-sulfur cluster assembly protein